MSKLFPSVIICGKQDSRRVLCHSNLTHRSKILIVFYDSYTQRHFNIRMKPSSPKLPENDDLFTQTSHARDLENTEFTGLRGKRKSIVEGGWPTAGMGSSQWAGTASSAAVFAVHMCSWVSSGWSFLLSFLFRLLS